MATMVRTSMHFLSKNDLYSTTKPYSLRFEPPEGFPRSNITLERHEDLQIEDARPIIDEFSLEKQGFRIINLESKMAYEDFEDDARIVEIYLSEVANALQELLGASHVQIFEHTVRKRHEEFPVATGEPYRWNQPTSMAHVDTTSTWAADMVHRLNGDKAEDLLRGRIQCVNTWKPLRGPVRDWPLALCDTRTVHPDTDLEPADLVYAEYIVENRQIYHSHRHKWYYVSDQQPNEAWVFMQSDSDPSGISGVAHSAFPHPSSLPTDPPRESVEVRALVYYANADVVVGSYSRRT
ncbi:putative CmcJ-like methyltransferase [Polyplosphaeria fusca]|uniref:CmcJ-like methyltransferase n=1 Tax=Polyplosphaeria fusca TaxID=682080 RepID=A0A9P4R1W0_9PLEO|nr:putative CmcJ-like methyltransferase [Polyplosphaeria fusca]